MRENCTYGSMRGRTYPAGASRPTLHPIEPHRTAIEPVLVCKSNVEADQLKNRIIKAGDDYTKIYTGTGAKYTTCSKVSRFLRKLGVRNWKDNK